METNEKSKSTTKIIMLEKEIEQLKKEIFIIKKSLKG